MVGIGNGIILKPNSQFSRELTNDYTPIGNFIGYHLKFGNGNMLIKNNATHMKMEMKLKIIMNVWLIKMNTGMCFSIDNELNQQWTEWGSNHNGKESVHQPCSCGHLKSTIKWNSILYYVQQIYNKQLINQYDSKL